MLLNLSRNLCFVLSIFYLIIMSVSSAGVGISQLYWNPDLSRAKRASIPEHKSLMTNENCKDDLRRICTSLNNMSDNLSVLECIQTSKDEALATLSKACHHELWSTTRNLMDNDHLSELINPSCDLEWKQYRNQQNLLMTLLDNINTISTQECRHLVQRISLVAFSDFRIIGHFTSVCDNDIQKFRCGRIVMDRDNVSTSKQFDSTLEFCNGLEIEDYSYASSDLISLIKVSFSLESQLQMSLRKINSWSYRVGFAAGGVKNY